MKIKMSLANLFSILSLFAQTNQPTVYELPLPKGRIFWIDKEYNRKESVMFLEADSARDVIYMEMYDNEIREIVDWQMDGIVDCVVDINAKSNTVTTQIKNQKNAALFEEIQKKYNSALKFLERYLKK